MRQIHTTRALIDRMIGEKKRAQGVAHDASGPKTIMDLRVTRQLYESGLSMREVARVVGINHSSVHARLVRAGVKLRPNGKAHRHPRVSFVCDICGRTFKRAQYYAEVGEGSRSNPKPPSRRVCSRECYGRLRSQDNLERARNSVSVEINYVCPVPAQLR